MRLERRTFLRLALATAALPGVAPIASAQTYPTRPVRLICGFPGGGPNDIRLTIKSNWVGCSTLRGEPPRNI
jgi:hypothetical protein